MNNSLRWVGRCRSTPRHLPMRPKQRCARRLWPCGWWFRQKKHREFHLDKKHMEFFHLNVGFLTGMPLYSIAGLSIKIWESLLACHDILFRHVNHFKLDLLQIHWILEIEYEIAWLFGPRKVQRLRNALISEEAACDGGTELSSIKATFGFLVIFPLNKKRRVWGGEDGLIIAGIRGSTTVETWSQAEAKAELKVGDVV